MNTIDKKNLKQLLPQTTIYKNIEIRNFKKYYNAGIFRSNWIHHEDDYIKINKKLIEIKWKNIIYKIYAKIRFNNTTSTIWTSSTMDRLNIVFTNIENKEIICDDKDLAQRFYSKTYLLTDSFTLKLKLNSNSLHFNNNNITVEELLNKKITVTNNNKVII